MKLYLNDEHALDKGSIVGIFDMDTATVAQDTRKFLSEREREGCATVTTADIPVSFVVECDRDKKIKIYLTRNAPKALRRRAERFGI